MRLLLFCALLWTVPTVSQQYPKVDFTHIAAEIIPVASEKQIKGTVRYAFTLNKAVDSIALDAVHMSVDTISLNGVAISFTNTKKQLRFKAPRTLGKHQLKITYHTFPKQTVYFLGWDDTVKGNEEIWTQGQGKYTSHWLPSFDDMNEKVIFDLSFKVPADMVVIANGQQKETEQLGDQKWVHFTMKYPMSSYLVAFVVGNFNKVALQSSSKTPLTLYYQEKDSLRVEPTYRHMKLIFDFLEEEIGVSYPWYDYKQVPVQDFLYAGMENTTCTVFSNQYVVDSTAFVDKNYINVNAHELTHQWFGNLVTEVDGNHHWLHEGFATYYAYLAEQAIFGDDYMYWRLYKTARTLGTLSDDGNGEALTDPKASSLTFYEKGAWALLLLRVQIGDKAFKTGIKSYLHKYAYRNVTLTNFLDEMELASGQDLTAFREEWLEGTVFPSEKVMALLQQQSPSLQAYFNLKGGSAQKVGIDKVKTIWENTKAIPLKRQLLLEYPELVSATWLQQQILEEPLLVRQAWADLVPKVSATLRPIFETLLNDPSYQTQEVVLFKLWEAFPDQQKLYLDRSADWQGFPNLNLKQLWLALSLVTPGYRTSQKGIFYEALNGYTAPYFNFEIRLLAFQYLHQINAMSDVALKNLVLARNHHVWQFKKSCRSLLRKIYGTPDGKSRLDTLITTLAKEEQESLLKLLQA
ncbi:MAG: M1 family metallopeptidase [Bacteroidota bacterium]